MKNTIIKWYERLGFPKTYDDLFKQLIETHELNFPLDIAEYDCKKNTPQHNFLAYLYYCEQLEKFYIKRQIPSEILYATLSDIVIWTNVWFLIKGELGIGEVDWLRNHLTGQLFRLGRLQFAFGKFEKDYPKIDAKLGESTIEVHIPEDSKLSAIDCDKSFAFAEEFFEKYFPEYSYRFYTCHSWLLWRNLKDYLPENSNVILFGNRFLKIDSNKGDSILRYVFRWDATRENLQKFEAKTSLARAIKQSVMDEKCFFEEFGIINRKNI